MKIRLGDGILWLFAICLVLGLIWGLEQAAVGPVETGDVYPAYSSLRSDPMGAKALYESLAALPGLKVERLYKDRDTLAADQTMLVLGVDAIGWETVPEKALEEYEKLVANGGRLVFAFLPTAAHRRAKEKTAVEKRWGLKLGTRPGNEESGEAVPRETRLYFDAGNEWRRLGNREAIERDFGKGTVVLVADSFPLSNEGLREARDARFIADVVGDARTILFDENHFGVSEVGSVTVLMRRYHLQGAVAVLAVVAGLFLWRSGSSLLPARETKGTGAVEGRDSMEGMTALLHRGVAEKDVAEVCFAEWSKSQTAEARVSRVEEEIRHAGKEDPVGAYRAACRVLSEKR